MLTFRIKKVKDQKTCYTAVASDISFDPHTLWEIDGNDLEISFIYLGSANTTNLNTLRKMIKKEGVVRLQSLREFHILDLKHIVLKRNEASSYTVT